MTGGIRPRSYFNPIGTKLPAYVVRVTHIAGDYANPWHDVIDDRAGVIKYWGDAKHSERAKTTKPQSGRSQNFALPYPNLHSAVARGEGLVRTHAFQTAGVHHGSRKASESPEDNRKRPHHPQLNWSQLEPNMLENKELGGSV